MQVQPVPIIARRMAILMLSVVAIDAAVALLSQHPAMWCAIIPGLIPLLTPAAIFFPNARPAN